MMLNHGPRIIRPNAGFILPGSRYLDIGMPEPKLNATGEFKLVKHERGVVIQETPWFDNLILNAGLERWGTNGCISGAGIGTGTSTPAAGQVGLDVESHWTATGGVGQTAVAAVAPNYNASYIFVYRTTLGALNGNYSEVAVGWAAGNSKFSRALILDGSLNPTTIAVSSTQQLDIWYRFSIYPPLVDIGPTNITISGVTYSVTGRAASVTSNTGSTGWNPNRITSAFGTPTDGGGFSSIFDAAMGAITSVPGGLGSTASGNTADSYIPGSLTKTGSMLYGLGNGNFAAFVKATLARWGPCCFQYEFNPVIPKDNTKTLVLNFSASWARRP